MASLEAGASGLEGWRAEHSLQLEHIALPESLVTRVFSKLGVGEDGGQEVMDAGASFTDITGDLARASGVCAHRPVCGQFRLMLFATRRAHQLPVVRTLHRPFLRVTIHSEHTSQLWDALVMSDDVARETTEDVAADTTNLTHIIARSSPRVSRH